MKEQRWPWLLAGGVMFASAVAAAWSTYLYWLPCRGTMLEGTLLQPFSGDGRTYEEYEKLDPAIKASMDACLRRMDGDISGQAPDVRHRLKNLHRADHGARADTQAGQIVALGPARGVFGVLAPHEEVRRLVLRVQLALGASAPRDLAPVRLTIDQHAGQLLPVQEEDVLGACQYALARGPPTYERRTELSRRRSP